MSESLFFFADWREFFRNQLNGWEAMNLSWARNFTGSLKIVHYDDLVQGLEVILRSILEFLEFPINEVNQIKLVQIQVNHSLIISWLMGWQMQSLLKCTLQRKEGIFRRKKRMLPFDPYTPEMHQMLDERKRYVYRILDELHSIAQ